MLLERLFVEIAADASKLERALRGADKDLMRFARRMENIGQTMSLALTAPLLAIGGASVGAAANLESIVLGLTAVTGSAGEANAQLDRLRELAKRPVIDLEIAAQSSMALQAIGKDAQFAERMIAGVGNAIALSGGGRGEFEGVMRQLRQVASLGRLMGEELNIILENAPAMASAIQQAFGTTSAEAIRELNLTSDEFFERLMQGMEALPTAAAGAKTSIENLWAALREGAAAIGDVLLPVVIPLVEKITEFASGLRDVNPTVVAWGVAFAGVAAALGPVLLLVGQLVPAIVALKAAGVALVPIFGVGGLIILGLTAVAALFLETSRNSRDLERATADLEAANRRLANSFRQANAEGTLMILGRRRMELQRIEEQMAEVGTPAMDDVEGLRNWTRLADAHQRLSATIGELEQQYIRLANAQAVVAAATTTTTTTTEEAVVKMKALTESIASGPLGEELPDFFKKTDEAVQELEASSSAWTGIMTSGLTDVVFEVENLADALRGLLAMIARAAVGQAIGSIVGAILNPVGTLVGGVGKTAAPSLAAVGPASYRVPDLSHIPDGVFLTDGRKVKDWLAGNFRGLEEDGFRAR